MKSTSNVQNVMIRGLLGYLFFLYVVWIPFHQYTHRPATASTPHQHEDVVFANDVCLVCDWWMRHHSHEVPAQFVSLRTAAPYFYYLSNYTLHPPVVTGRIHPRGPPGQIS